MFNSQGSLGGWKSSVSINLIIINALMLIATSIFESRGISLNNLIGLHYIKGSDFNVVQVITYMFLHADFSHLFFNMFSLFMFGPLLERVLGPKRFLFYYISCGIGAAIVQEIVWSLTWVDMLALSDGSGFVTMRGEEALAYVMQHDMLDEYLNSFLTIGASGAVFGILLAFGMIFPNMPLFLMFIPIPIKAKWMVIGYGAIELFFGINGIQNSVAHFAHLGGMIFGLLILIYWKRKGITGGGTYQ